jgi:hypothetical protein
MQQHDGVLSESTTVSRLTRIERVSTFSGIPAAFESIFYCAIKASHVSYLRSFLLRVLLAGTGIISRNENWLAMAW